MDKKGVSGSFSKQTTITSVKFGNQCYFVSEHAFQECTSLGEINDDNVLESIGSNAFAQTNLKSAKFNNLNILYNAAFQSCSNLNYISIPKCENIPMDAFSGCKSLNQIEMSNVLSIDKTAFAECTSLSSINIPNCSVIGTSAFISCTNLKYVNNAGNNITLSNYAFKDCTNLKDIYFDNIIKIGTGAFINCKSLDKVNLKQCSTIGIYAFSGCTNINIVTLNACKEIGEFAFTDCNNLNKVYINNPPNIICKLDKYAFCNHNDNSSDSTHNITFYINAESFDYYYNDDNWKHYQDNMVKTVSNNQIMYMTSNGSAIDIDDSIKEQMGIIKNSYFTTYGLIEFNEKVESLNSKIFQGKTTLTSIDIPSECECIEANAFDGCVNLTNITLSPNLKRIDDYAFKNCKAFTSFEIPDSVEQLGDGIFAGCENIEKFEGKFVTYNGKAIVYEKRLICILPKDDSITEGRIHKLSDISDIGILYLGKSCFSGCVNMRRVDIDSNIEYIGDNAFEGCTNLCEIHFYWGVPPKLGKNVFDFENVREDLKIFVPEARFEYYHDKWSTVTESNETEYLFNIYPSAGKKFIIYYTNNTESEPSVNLSLPNGKYFKISYTNDTIKLIFESKTEITKVILGENITKIGQNAFKNCKNLEYIYISDNATQLQNDCFYGCENLTRIHIPSGFEKSSNSVGSNVFYGCIKLKEFGTYYKNRVSADNRCYIDSTNRLTFFAQGGLPNGETYSIPNYVSEIHKTAFRGSNIEKIKLTMSTKEIGEYAFSECSNLKSIENWDNVETISAYAFNGCSDLGNISLPSKLKTISSHAFDGCESMYIDKNIPDSVTVIGSYAFNDCFNFKYIDDIKKEQVALNLGNISCINELSFHNCSSLTKVNINDKISRIGFKSFANCSQLQSVSISNSSILSQIENFAFYNCEKLEELYLPESLQYIGESAFEHCGNYKGGTYLESPDNTKTCILFLPNNVTSMGTACFRNSGIEVLNIMQSSKLSVIPENAFESCNNLKNVNMSRATNIQTISSNAFKNCTKLYGASQLSLSDETEFQLPNSIKYIKDGAFDGCSSIVNVTLPIYLKSLGDFCFATGNPATHINVPISLSTPPAFTKNNITNIESNPFGDITSTPTKIPEIFVNSSFISTYKNDKYWKKYTRRITSVAVKEILEEYISSIICDTNGFSPVVSGSWSANVVFDSNIPIKWVGTTVYFNVYDESDRLLLHPGGINNQWTFTLTDNLATGGMPQVVVIITGGYSSLGGTETNPAKYIKITSVSNTIVKYSGDDIGISNC